MPYSARGSLITVVDRVEAGIVSAHGESELEGADARGDYLPDGGIRAGKPRAYAIGLDITRWQVTVVALDLRGQVLYSLRETRKFDRPEAYASFLGDPVQEIVRTAVPELERIFVVAVSPCLVC